MKTAQLDNKTSSHCRSSVPLLDNTWKIAIDQKAVKIVVPMAISNSYLKPFNRKLLFYSHVLLYFSKYISHFTGEVLYFMSVSRPLKSQAFLFVCLFFVVIKTLKLKRECFLREREGVGVFGWISLFA